MVASVLKQLAMIFYLGKNKMNENTSTAIIIAFICFTVFGSIVLNSYVNSLVIRECYEASKTNKDLKCEK